MDKQSIIGLILIGAILAGYTLFSRPNAEEREALEIKRDSIIQAEHTRDSLAAITFAQAQAQNELQKDEIAIPDSLSDYVSSDSVKLQQYKDSVKTLELKNKYGVLSKSMQGESQIVTIENSKIILKLNSKGGKIHSVELKDYKTHDGQPLILFEGDEEVKFGFKMLLDNRPVNTNDVYFEYMGQNTNISVPANDSASVSFRLNAGDDKYIEFTYTLRYDDWIVDYNVNLKNMNDVLAGNVNYIEFKWDALIPGLEKGRKWETQNTTIQYCFDDNSVEKINERKTEDEISTPGNINWVAYKQQFFSTIIIYDGMFEDPSFYAKNIEENEDSIHIEEFNTEMTLAYLHETDKNYDMHFYFGPNKYKTLKSYDRNMEKLIPLGWGIFGWFNRFLIIPVFNWLGRGIASYGLIILLLTLIIKLILFPLTYKSYMSTAKMKVLKPQLDKLAEKYPKGKEAEKQQATMALYKKAGVNPMGGCLPMLLQMPILLAMFRFFPASIELRQKSFLWATDLSSFDSILDLPFKIPMYGDHISLFSLLMAVSMIFSTKINNSNQPSGQNQATMKMMTWMMPIMMLLVFNNYAAGLSYYYLLANLMTILQTWIIRRYFVDEKAVLAKLNANKGKSAKPKSNWQKRLEEAAKQKGYNPPKK